MGRILILLGVAMIIFSIVAFSSSIMGTIGGAVNSAVNTAISTPNADEYCNPDETLEESQGSSQYTPGQGYASSVQYYCVDDAGNRRDVTGQFAENLLGGMSGIFSSFSSPFRMEYVALFGGGVLALFIGIFVSVSRGRRRFAAAQTMNFDFSSGTPVPGSPSGTRVQMNGQEYVTTPEMANQIRRMQNAVHFTNVVAGTPAAQTTGDLKSRLSQLDEALKANLISQEEYDRLRQQLLDQMR